MAKAVKTYVFDKDGKFLRARPSRLEAIASTKEVGCFLFSQADVKAGKHKRFFKKIKKHSL